MAVVERNGNPPPVVVTQERDSLSRFVRKFNPLGQEGNPVGKIVEGLGEFIALGILLSKMDVCGGWAIPIIGIAITFMAQRPRFDVVETSQRIPWYKVRR